MTKRWLSLLLLLGMIVGLVGCDRGGKLPTYIQTLAEADSPGCLRIGLSGGVGELNPILQQEEHSALLQNMLHAGPLKIMPDGTYQGDLWREWSTAIDDAGNLSVTGIWREGLSWHDGQEFSAEDFSFTIELMKNPKVRSPYRRLSNQIDRIEQVPAERKTQVFFRGNSRQFLDLLCVGLVPQHLLKDKDLAEATTKAPEGIEGQTYGVATGEIRFSQAPIGLGCYRITKMGGRRFLLLERSARPIPEEWATAIAPAASAPVPVTITASEAFPQILVRFYYSPEYLVEDLKKGTLDWATIPSEFAAKIEELKILRQRFLRHPNPGVLFLALNLRHEPFNSVEFRRALGLTLDRTRLKNLIPFEGSVSSDQPLWKNAFDPAQAGTILDSLGLKDTNHDGVREHGGKPLVLELLINQESLLRKMVAEEIAKMLQKVGITVEVKTEFWADFISNRLGRGMFDAALLHLHLPMNGNWLHLWHSRSIPAGASATAETSPAAGVNFTGVNRPELDTLLEQIDRQTSGTDIGANSELRRQVETILGEEFPGAFLFAPKDVSVAAESLSGPDDRQPIWSQNWLFWRKSGQGSKGAGN